MICLWFWLPSLTNAPLKYSLPTIILRANFPARFKVACKKPIYSNNKFYCGKKLKLMKSNKVNYKISCQSKRFD